MARGFGDHHSTGKPSLYQGKMPAVYAARKRATDKSPPMATRPSSSPRRGSGKMGGASGLSRTGRWGERERNTGRLSAPPAGEGAGGIAEPARAGRSYPD